MNRYHDFRLRYLNSYPHDRWCAVCRVGNPSRMRRFSARQDSLSTLNREYAAVSLRISPLSFGDWNSQALRTYRTHGRAFWVRDDCCTTTFSQIDTALCNPLCVPALSPSFQAGTCRIHGSTRAESHCRQPLADRNSLRNTPRKRTCVPLCSHESSAKARIPTAQFRDRRL